METSTIATLIAAAITYFGIKKKNAKMAVVGAVLTLACLAATVDGFLNALGVYWTDGIVDGFLNLLGSIF